MSEVRSLAESWPGAEVKVETIEALVSGRATFVGIPGLSELVVMGFPIRTLEDLVGLPNILEFFLSFRASIDVWVEFPR